MLLKKVLTGSIGDADSDTIKYRILLNSIIKEDWSQLIPSPANIRYVMKQRNIVIGYSKIALLKRSKTN